MTAFHTYEQIIELINASITLTARVTVRLHIIEHPGNFVFNVDIIAPSGNNTYPISESSEYGHAYALAEDFYIRLAYLYENNNLVRILDEINNEKAGEPLPPLPGKKKVETIEVVNLDKSTTSDVKLTDDAEPTSKRKNNTVNSKPFVPKKRASSSEIQELLKGFDFPATRGMPEIYIGKRNRLYLKGVFRSALGIEPQTRIIIGYRLEDNAFAIIKPEAVGDNPEAQAAGYFVSLRYDVTAAKMFKQYNLDRYEGQTYYFDKASSDASVAIFRRY